MAAQLTDREKAQIVADYVQCGSYRAVAKAHGRSDATVRKVVSENAHIKNEVEEAKEEARRDILAHMEEKRDKVCDIVDMYLDALLDKKRIEKATPSQLTTALGTLIDKWTGINAGPGGPGREDDLSRSLREMGEGLEGD